MTARWGNHPPCPGGCGQLADECACANPNLLGSMVVHVPASREELMATLAERVAAEVCACGHTRKQHTYYDECGVDFESYGSIYPCLCTRFTR